MRCETVLMKWVVVLGKQIVNPNIPYLWCGLCCLVGDSGVERRWGWKKISWPSPLSQALYQQTGIYRISGCDKTVRELKEKFLRSKNIPLLSKVDDIHAICGLLKDFLRSLKEPLLTFRLNKTFMEAAGEELLCDISSSFLRLSGWGFAVKWASNALWSPCAWILVGQDTRLLTQHEKILAYFSGWLWGEYYRLS